MEEEARGRGGQAGERVQERDHDGHVGAADREHEEDAEDERGHDQRDHERVTLGAGDDQPAEDEATSSTIRSRSAGPDRRSAGR